MRETGEIRRLAHVAGDMSAQLNIRPAYSRPIGGAHKYCCSIEQQRSFNEIIIQMIRAYWASRGRDITLRQQETLRRGAKELTIRSTLTGREQP